MSRSWSIIRDLFSDGYKLVGAIAPLLSISFTLAKYFDLPIELLRSMSYAWALLPLLVWVLIAYVRRWLLHDEARVQLDGDTDRLKKLATLAAVRQRGVQLRNSAPASQAELDKWRADSEAWINDAYEAAGALSTTLRARIETLDEMRDSPNNTPTISPDQVFKARVISEILRRIGSYLERNQ